jgi:prophage regulatory protein
MTYITLQELQTKLGGRSRSAIYVDLEQGRLPKPMKLGRRLYWRDDQLNDHLEKLQEAQGV